MQTGYDGCRPRLLLLDLLLRPTDVREKEKLRELQSVVSAFPTCKDERERAVAAFSLPDCRKSCTDSAVLCGGGRIQQAQQSALPALCLPVLPSRSVGLSVQFSVFSLQLSVARAVAGQVLLLFAVLLLRNALPSFTFLLPSLALSHFTLSACALVFCFSVHFLSLFLSSLPSFLYQHLLLLFFFCC